MTERPERPALPPDARDRALTALFLATGRPAAWMLGLIYLGLALAKSFLYAAPSSLLTGLSLVDLTVALTFFGLAIALHRATPESRWVQPATVLAVIVLLADSVLTMHYLFKPLETTVFVLMAFGSSLVFTSPRWFHLTLFLIVAGWDLAVFFSAPGPPLSPGAAWVELGITLFSAVVAAELMFLHRRRVFLEIEALRAAEARQHAELEAAMDTLRAQHDQLQVLMRFRTDFVDAIAHDLRNPLTSLRGFTELLAEEPPETLPERERSYIAQMEKSVRRIERLIDDMLDLARLESGNFTLALYLEDFGRMVSDLAESFRPQARLAGLELSVTLPEERLYVEMDVERVERVVGNLITNALKFTRAGGRVEIAARIENHQLLCEVSDTGVGIAPDELPRLFQRFSQLEQGKKARGGTGLGLNISKAIVEAHGGAIGVRSTQGEGSTFWFTLPLRHTKLET